MIGELPTTLNIGGKDIPIRSDYRTALVVIQAMNDPDLNDLEKSFIMLDALMGIENIPAGAYREAIQVLLLSSLTHWLILKILS